MVRHQFMAGIVGVVGLFAWATGVMAEDPKPAKPAGVRVGQMLIFFGCESTVAASLVEAAGIEGHQWGNGPYIGTWHDIKGEKALQNKRLEPLEQGDFDLLLLATPDCYPNADSWAGHVGLDSTPALLCDMGVKNNPRFRLVWQSYYWPRAERQGDKNVLQWKPRTGPPDGLRALEKLADQINEKHGRKVMAISPAEEAACRLIEMVAAGTFPGISDPVELWVAGKRLQDLMWVPGSHMRTLFAYTNVATIYGVSPVGLNPDFSTLTWGGGKSAPTDPKSFADLAPITEEQRRILQQIAWDTVSSYPQAGVKKP
jgi:hypothetical protein